MKSQGVIFDLADTADARFDRVIEWMLIGLLAFMPLALGAVQPWSELVVVTTASLMALVLAAKLLVRPDVRFVRTWAYVPMLAFLALVLAQLIPLPGSLVKLISPGTVSLRSELLQAVPGASTSNHITLSFYPEATLGQLRLLLAVCAIFVVAVNVVRRLAQVKRLLAAIAIIGSVVAVLALAQNLTDAQQIYWFIPLESNAATSGPFVNHGHGAQFFNLSIGAALGLMLMHLDQLPPHRLHQGASIATRAITRPVTRPIWMLACAVIAMGVCVPLSLSRAGMIALTAAGAVTGAVVATRRGIGGRTWIFVGIVLAAVAVMLAFDFEGIVERATSLADPRALGGRMDILRGAGEIAKTFPVAGTGLGTFEFVFPPFDPASMVKTAEHAENEYAQLLVETGGMGALIMLSFLAIAIVAYARSVRGAPSPMASGAMGLGFGVVAILVHSAADFAQHVPAVAALSAISLALLINLAQATRRRDAAPGELPKHAPRWPRVAGATVAMGVAAFTVFDAAQVFRADQHRIDAAEVERDLDRAGWQGSDRAFARLILGAQRASESRPRNVVLRYELNRYRWKSLERGLERSPRLDEADLRDARRVIEELLVCPRLCPTYAPPYLLAGQLMDAFLGDARGEALVRTGHRLGPANPDANIAVAVLEARAGRWDWAGALLRRTIELSADHRDDVIDVALDGLDRPELALQLAADQRDSLLRLAGRLDDRGAASEVADAARARGDQLLLERARDAEASAATLAEAAQLLLRRAQHADAIALLRRATTIEYGQHDFRLLLARALAEHGKVDQALTELRNILRQSPSHPDALALLQQLDPPTTRRAERPPTPVPREPATLPATAPGFKLE